MSRVDVIAAQKSYGATPVLRSLSLRVEAGEFMVLLGPSGCGKSTLLHAIAGLDDLDAGQVLIDGRDVTAEEPKDRGIAMVFQSYALYPTMTVRDNLGFGLRMAGVARAEIARRIATTADLLQIGDMLDRKPAQLSGGQRQRVAIGRAIVRKVSVFLFDEPLSNLDAKLRTEMRVELKRLHEQLGATMVYVTHDQTEAMTLATRIAVLRAGAIEQCDVPQAIYSRPANLFVAGFVGSPQINTLAGRVCRDGPRAAVMLAGLPDSIHDVAGVQALADGAEVMLAIRPEDLALAAPDATGALPVQLLLRETLGAETLVWCTAGPHRICLRLPPDRAQDLPKSFHILPVPGKSRVFDPAGGMRIE